MPEVTRSRPQRRLQGRHGECGSGRQIRIRAPLGAEETRPSPTARERASPGGMPFWHGIGQGCARQISAAYSEMVCASPTTRPALNRAGRTRSCSAADHAISRAVELGHIPTLINVYAFKTTLEMFRADAQRTLRDAETLVEIAGRNGLAWFLNFGTLSRGWARARLSDRDAGMAEMREALGKYADEGFWGFFPHFLGRLAELEIEGQGAEAALAHIDEAVTLARRTGERWTDALLHRIRGDILLKAESEHPVRAEDAYRAAISIARDQGARSFGLQAALRLAKLYQSTGRPSVEAHDALAPALEGFAPTPEMPEIAEAQAMLAALSQTAEVKRKSRSGSD